MRACCCQRGGNRNGSRGRAWQTWRPSKILGVPINPTIQQLAPQRGHALLGGAVHGGIGYRHWLGFLQLISNKPIISARSVANFREKRNGYRLWAFGYDMDKMKAWVGSGCMPLIMVDEKAREVFVHRIQSMVQGADETAGQLRWAVKTALFGGGEIRGDLACRGKVLGRNRNRFLQFSGANLRTIGKRQGCLRINVGVAEDSSKRGGKDI